MFDSTDTSGGLDSLPGTIGDPRDENGDRPSDLGKDYSDTGGNSGYTYNPFLLDSGTGPGSNNEGAYGSPLNNEGPNSGSNDTFLSSLWKRFQNYGMGRGVQRLAQNSPGVSLLANPAIAAAQAPEGQGANAAGKAIGSSAINTAAYAIPPLGILNSLFGMFTGNTLGSYAMNHAGTSSDPSKYDNSGRGGSSSRMDDVLTGLAGMYANNRSNNILKDQQNSLSGMYGQNSPFSQALRSQLERRDAAGGRRSQYGPREVELQAHLAQLASRNAPTIANLGQQRNQNNMQNLNSLMYLGRNSGMFKDFGDTLSGLWNTNNPNQPGGSGWGMDLGQE